MLDLFWISVKLCSSRVEEGLVVSAEIQRSLSLSTKWLPIAFDTICYVGKCRIKNYLMSEGNFIAWPEKLFSIHY